MKKQVWMFAAILFCINQLIAQDASKTFFDVSGKATEESQAYYYRVLETKPNLYKAYYMSGKLYYEATILTADEEDETNNKYTGNCIWYYKNEKKKIERNYNPLGIEDGTTYFYYESGKVWKEIEYKNGSIINGRYREYSEKGDVTSIFEEPFNNNVNDWDMYVSNASSAKIVNGLFELKSLTKEGTSRTINIPINSEDYIIETTFDNSDSKGNRVGLS